MTALLRLSEADDPCTAGNKAVALSRAARAGAPVPDGLVVPTSALGAVLTALPHSRQARQQALRHAPLPAAVGSALERAAAHFARAEFGIVVRSSSPVEDSATKSYAGHF